MRRKSSENIHAIENSKMQIRLCALSNTFIKIYNIISEEKYTYIVMESLNGTLMSKIGAELSWHDILKIMQPIFQAIYAAHKCGILLLQDIDYKNIYITNAKKINITFKDVLLLKQSIFIVFLKVTFFVPYIISKQK